VSGGQRSRARAVWFFLGLILLTAASIGFWWVTAPSPREGALARIERDGVIRVGYAVEAPYAFLDARGELTGEEIELARIVVKGLGIPRIEWRQTEFESLLSQLEAGRFDVIVAGMYITPERARRARFSEPTFHVRQALLVRAGNPHRLHAYEDVRKDARLRIAAVAGSIEESMILGAGVPEAQILLVPDALTGRVAVESGLAAGLALSSPTIHFMARRHALGVTEVAEPFTPPARTGGRLEGFGAVAFRSADGDLCGAWNRQLKEFVGSEAHRRLMAQFGFTEGELPSGATTAEILSSGAR